MNNLKLFASCLVLSVIFVSLFSYSTSPLYMSLYGSDSAQFQTIGKGWSLGLIPYRDLFDHKGPLIFFINAIGYKLLDSKLGIFFIQCILFTFVLLGICKICKLKYSYIHHQILFCFISLILLSRIFEGGNLTEEYCLPFLVYSIYLQYFSLEEYEFDGNVCYFLFYGITISVCFLTRLTNAVYICVGVCVLVVKFIIKKEYLFLFKNLIAIFIGFLLVFIPFSIYFYNIGCFYEFFYGTILYNMEYKKHFVSWLNTADLDDCIDFIFDYFLSYSVFLISALCYFKKKTGTFFYFFIIGCSEVYLFLTGARYAHYCIINLPFLAFLLNELKVLDKNLHKLRLLICALICYMSVHNLIYSPITSYRFDLDNALERKLLYRKVLNYVNKSDPIVLYSGEMYKDFYLVSGIEPCYKYFILQEWHSRFSIPTKNDIRKVFSQNIAKWIICDSNTENIQNILDDSYKLVVIIDDLRIYGLKSSLFEENN